MQARLRQQRRGRVRRWRLRPEQRRPRLLGVKHGSSTLEELLGYLRDVGLTHVDGLWKHGADALDRAERAMRLRWGDASHTQSGLS